jgi:hypothetical protein
MLLELGVVTKSNHAEKYYKRRVTKDLKEVGRVLIQGMPTIPAFGWKG